MADMSRPYIKVAVEPPASRTPTVSELTTIRSATVTKTLTNPTGTFSITLRRRRPNNAGTWNEAVGINDLLTIEIGRGAAGAQGGRGGNGTVIVMLGLVESIRDTIGVDEKGRREEQCVIDGSDVAALLANHHISNRYSITEQSAQAHAALFSTKMAGSDSRITKLFPSMLSAIESLGYPRIKFPSWQRRGGFHSLIELDVTTTLQSLTDIAAQYSGPTWGLFERIAPPPFLELYLDTHGGKMILTVRETPYDTLESLPSTSVSTDDISEREIGRGGQSVVNVAFVGTQIFNKPVWLNPTVHRESLNIFGIRQREIRTGFIPRGGKVTKGQHHTFFQELQKRVVRWYARSDLLYAGYLACRGRPDVTIGTTVLADVHADGHPYRLYVQGVHHSLNFDQAPQFVTTLTVDRGAPA